MDNTIVLKNTDNIPKYNDLGEQLYTIEEAFDKIDTPFVEFYGEYGKQMVNARREEWNKKGIWNFKKF